MDTLFKHLKFSRRKDYTKSVKDSKWEFFIPGINSGAYIPASLHILVLITQQKAGFFKLNVVKTSADITLTPSEFDSLYEEMTKIKNIRDNFKTTKK